MNFTDFPIEPGTCYSPLARPLVAEWEQLSHDPSVHRRIVGWGLADYRHGGDLGELLRAIGMHTAANDVPAEARMRALVRLAATDDLAARAVLQRLLPSLVGIAKRRALQLGTSRQPVFDDLVAQAWIVIRTYPIERRSGWVAGSMIRDIEYGTFTRDRRRRGASEVPVNSLFDEQPTTECEAEPMTVVIELLRSAQAQGGVPAEDLRFALAWASGASTAQLAETFDLCDRSVRNRRNRVVSGLRRVAQAEQRALSAA